MPFLFYFIAVNTLLSLIYVFITASQRKPAGAALLFLFLPYIGMALYFLPVAIKKFNKDAAFDDTGLVLRAEQVELMPEAPKLKEELNVTPLEDALTVGENSEKRALLLRELKKDLRENYKTLLKAENDEDSEASHYVAAAKMEIYRMLQQHWLEARKDYEKDSNDVEVFRRACAALNEIFYSEIFSKREVSAYKKYYLKLVGERLATNKADVSLTEFEEYLNCLADLGEAEEVTRLWEEGLLDMKSEKTYIRLLKMFYESGDLQKFKLCYSELCKNRQIRLSAKGLETIRYWAKKLNPPSEGA